MTEESTAPRKRGRPRKQETDVGREGLIKAAMEVFATVDPALVNRQILAERIGVDPNLIRYYFGNMQKLFVEVITETHRSARADMSALRKEAKPLERLRYRIERQFNIFRGNPYHHKMVMMALFDDADSEAQEEWAAILRDSLADLSEIIAAGVKEGSMRKVDPHFLYLMIISVCEFWNTNTPIVDLIFANKGKRKTRDSAYIDFIYDIIVRALAPTR
ncbi:MULTISPECIES: TetR family transcriptional regulator C-terminal domain-containing protein [unclassified Beijerinckia]|uniref:TetR/AcrR family transcriptional regulator n=1 Tax=unclassified Beijerinckia TaxID=2638183 RepID=UPI0008958508|nr:MULTISPECIES: TetR family transcriptional regulator C-terminal domain-containing protein [unclassified Beijerinckia]MDH7799020.1 AcrR family transcriptional regulator [Beijerinckia sp. GAS462]SED84133.1 transcriptional regulator, TetR family [Beijerinckia sp. 28-YEA-48]